MSFSLFPSFKFRRVEEITPEFLRSQDIRLLLLDLDNTLIPYSTVEPRESVARWLEDVRAAGITPFIVSNSKRTRPAVFAEAFGLPYIQRARKPSPRGVREAMETVGEAREHTALVGDQIYTDMLAASLAGVTGLLVHPIRFTNVFLALRWVLELPFRHALGRKRRG